jgi:signal peptidase I
VIVAEASMAPAIQPGDWLLVDPTVRRWPRRGSVVLFREPITDVLAIKRVAARPGDWVPFADGWLQLADDEAWLVGDASDEAVAASGFGTPADSRRYGPVPVEALVGRAWFRYGPPARIGRLDAAPPGLLARGRTDTRPGSPGPDAVPARARAAVPARTPEAAPDPGMDASADSGQSDADGRAHATGRGRGSP